ncbi:glutaredoxin-like protein [Nannochloropsis oceanica]
MPRPRPSVFISSTLILLRLLLSLTTTTTITHAFFLPSSPSPAPAPRPLPSLSLPSYPLAPLHAVPDGLLDEDGEPQYDAPTRARIENLIQENKIVLFMKGNRLFPSCGFSNTAIRILDQLNVEYETVDVLADERIRGEIKRYSAWPTIPQLYLQGEFVGGSDIILEMYQTGELQEMIEIAAAS